MLSALCMHHARRFGIAHILLATTSEEACRSTVALIQGACCVWQDLEVMKTPVADHAFGHHRLLAQTRWALQVLINGGSIFILYE